MQGSVFSVYSLVILEYILVAYAFFPTWKNLFIRDQKYVEWYWSVQEISDSVIESIVTTLRNLQVLVLCYCLGDMSISGFMFSMPNLRKLQLERVTPWLTNDELVIMTQSCPNLIELSLLGCKHLNSGEQ